MLSTMEQSFWPQLIVLKSSKGEEKPRIHVITKYKLQTMQSQRSILVTETSGRCSLFKCNRGSSKELGPHLLLRSPRAGQGTRLGWVEKSWLLAPQMFLSGIKTD